MVVITIDNAAESTRGILTRWLIEIKPGVFIGNVSKRVRSYLWNDIIESRMEQHAIMAYSYPCEQGYMLQTYGDPFRHVCELDGLQLIGNYTDRADNFHKIFTNERRNDR